MANLLGSLHIKVTRAVATGELTLYQANQIHSILSFRSVTATATELIDLKVALIAAVGADIVTQAQADGVFALIPELRAA